MTTKSGITLINSSSCKLKFTLNFIRSLSKIKSRKPISPPSGSELRSRTKQIKIAAYSSMARAVGPGKAWARALLFKLHTRARLHPTLMRRRNRAVRFWRTRPDSGERVKKLRQLVPGGEGMKICTLLEETAHYIHCLTTQVKVMKVISQLSN